MVPFETAQQPTQPVPSETESPSAPSPLPPIDGKLHATRTLDEPPAEAQSGRRVPGLDGIRRAVGSIGVRLKALRDTETPPQEGGTGGGTPPGDPPETGQPPAEGEPDPEHRPPQPETRARLDGLLTELEATADRVHVRTAEVTLDHPYLVGRMLRVQVSELSLETPGQPPQPMATSKRFITEQLAMPHSEYSSDLSSPEILVAEAQGRQAEQYLNPDSLDPAQLWANEAYRSSGQLEDRNDNEHASSLLDVAPNPAEVTTTYRTTMHFSDGTTMGAAWGGPIGFPTSDPTRLHCSLRLTAPDNTRYHYDRRVTEPTPMDRARQSVHVPDVTETMRVDYPGEPDPDRASTDGNLQRLVSNLHEAIESDKRQTNG